MKIFYLASVDVSEFNAPANHVKECVKVMSVRHDTTLICARKKLFQRVPELDGVRLIPIFFPGINGGWRYFERMASRVLKSSGCTTDDVVYLRTSPSRVIARTLREIECTKVLEVNGAEVSSHPHFASMVEAVSIVLVGTDSMRRELIAVLPQFASKVLVHSNIGVDFVHFRPRDKSKARVRLGLPSDAKLAIHVSGFQPHHDFETLLLSANAVAARVPDFQLILVGDGERHAAIKEDASKLVASGIVNFPGAVATHVLSDYIASADVCINSMTQTKLLFHGNGNAQKTMEYLACGRPVIETIDPSQDVPAWLEGHAICISPGDPDEMAGAIFEALEHNAKWSQAAIEAREELAGTHSWKAVVENTLSLVRQVQVRSVR